MIDAGKARRTISRFMLYVAAEAFWAFRSIQSSDEIQIFHISRFSLAFRTDTHKLLMTVIYERAFGNV